MQVHTGKRHELCYAQHRKDCSLYTYLIRTPDSPFTTADTCTYRPFRADASISHTGDIRPQRLHNKASARIGLHTEDKRFRPDIRYDITVPQRPVCRDIAFTNAIKKIAVKRNMRHRNIIIIIALWIISGYYLPPAGPASSIEFPCTVIRFTPSSEFEDMRITRWKGPASIFRAS